jgi:hypothetical protein
MAIFKAPKLTTMQRSNLVLEVSELVYDVDKKAFFGGDGSNPGGFPVGATSGFVVENIELTPQNILDKFVTLRLTPLIPSAVIVTPEGGIPQVNGVDFEIIDNKVSWKDKGLDGFLDNTDVLIIQY